MVHRSSGSGMRFAPKMPISRAAVRVFSEGSTAQRAPVKRDRDMAEMNGRTAALLDHLQVRSRARRLHLVVAALLLRRIRVVREDHSLARLSGVDSQHRAHWHPDVKWHARESRAEANGIVGQFEIMRRRLTDIQNDPAILDMLSRYVDTIEGRVNNDMWRVSVVAHPFVHGTNEVGPF